MLLWLTEYLQQYYSGFRVFQYLTFRAILAILTSLVISFIIWPFMLKLLVKFNLNQTIRARGPERHYDKSGTPTMGGGLLLIGVFSSTLLWSKLSNIHIWLVLLVTIAYGIIGFVDDYLKIKKSSSNGLPARYKFLSQSLVAVIVGIYIYNLPQYQNHLYLLLPYIKHTTIDLGPLFIVLTYLVIVGSSNAVNLTDGLDGLAIMPAVLVIGALGIFAYVSGNVSFSSYLALPYLNGVGELLIFCTAFIGAGLGFLWFNTYPAQVFMGDIGALSIGAAMGMVAVLVRQELVLFIMGGLFVVETISVVLQVASFKITGRRIFKMAPVHHHFELKGWPEPKIIVRFWIVSVILVLIGLASIKVR